MTADLVTSIAMFASCLVLAISMWVAWAHLGRARHALSWGVAYLAYGIEVMTAVVQALIPSLRWATEPVAFALVLVAAVLVAVGARQRSGAPDWRNRLFCIAGFVFIVVEAFRIRGMFPWLSVTDGIFTSSMLLIGIISIKNHRNKTEPAETVLICSLSVFIGFELMLSFLDILSQLNPEDIYLSELYLNIYLSGIVPVFMATGVSAILLIASDVSIRLRLLAATDPLTGALNRRGFLDAARDVLEAGRISTHVVTFALVDIDHFKGVNDKYGHHAGDAVLQFVCDRLMLAVGGDGLVGRIGGEEFALLIIRPTPDLALEVLERAREAIAQTGPDNGPPIPSKVTASFGVSQVPCRGDVSDGLMLAALNLADEALYQSKINGRNRITLTGRSYAT